MEYTVDPLNGSPVMVTHSFKLQNQAIKSWYEEADIHHELSSAYNPEGNGEAEISVKKVKLAFSHAGDKLDTISATVANLN